MLWQRLLFGSLMITAILGLIFLDAWMSNRALTAPPPLDGFNWAHLGVGLPFTLLVLAMVLLGNYELASLCRSGGYEPARHWSAFVSAGLVLIPWMQMQQSFTGLQALLSAEQLGIAPSAVWLVGGFIGACLAVLARKKNERAVSHIAVTLFMLLYLGLLTSFVVRIRTLMPDSAGAVLVVYFILVVKSGDIGAYFIGSRFGRHKLAPWLSPGKTVEGAFGAIGGAMGVACLGMWLWPMLNLNEPPPFNMLQALVFGLFMAIVGHLGDLVESLIKRDVGRKDSGAIIPSFGGVLDLIDSPLFAAPIGWLLLTIAAGIAYN